MLPKKLVLVALGITAMFLLTTMAGTASYASSPSQSGGSGSGNYQFMPWICQFCGNQTNYTRTIIEHHNLFTDLSYEQYYLAANGSFQSLGVPDEVAMAHRYHLKAFPMIISSDPAYMHLLFSDSSIQQAFISTAVHTAVLKGYAGYNIDFEVPYYSDSARVTSFVSNFSSAMVQQGKQLTLDVIGFHGPITSSTYGSAYNYSALSNTSVSLIIVEDYYAWTDFIQAVNYSVAHIAPAKLMMALPDYGYAFYVNATSNSPFPNNLIPPYVNYSYSGMYGALKGILKTARLNGAQITHHFSNFYAESYFQVIYRSSPDVGNQYYYVGMHGMSMRLHYIESMGIHKAALWRAGATAPGIWPAIHQYKDFVELFDNLGFSFPWTIIAEARS